MQPRGPHGGHHHEIPSRYRGGFSPAISLPNPTEVPTIPYVYLFRPSLSEQLATSSTEGSVVTVGVIYHGYHGLPFTAQNTRYDRFPPAANDWRTIHPIPENDPTTPS
jgi:hypothetical protein